VALFRRLIFTHRGWTWFSVIALHRGMRTGPER
jgi:hypothetical protein